MDYAPPIAITPGMNHRCVEIGTLVGSLESRVPPRSTRVAKAIHQGQLQSLLLSQADEDLDLTGEQGESLVGAIGEARRRLDSYDPGSLSDIMRLNTRLADALGVWDVWRREEMTAPRPWSVPCAPASHVQQLLEQLLDWYDATEYHPLVKSCVFRYECAIIRPFACASDLTRRIWHARMLTRWNPVFHWADIEAVLRERSAMLSAAIGESRRRINDAPYVTLVLETILEALRRLDDRLDVAPARAANVEQVLLYFADHPAATISDCSATLGIALRTCARYVSELQKDGRLKRIGSRKKGTWKVLG